MWKKSNVFLRKIIVLSLLLLLVLLPLSALPKWLTGSAGAVQILQLQSTIADKEAKIESMNLYIAELQAQLDDLIEASEKWTTINKDLEKFIFELRGQLADLKTNLQARDLEMQNLRTAYAELQIQLEELVSVSTNSEDSDATLTALVSQLQDQLIESTMNLNLSVTEIERLKENLAQLETMTGLSKESFKSLMEEYLPLKVAYEEKSTEAARYFQETVTAKADAKARKFNGMVSVDGLYFPSGNLGVGVSGGFGYGEFMLILGAECELKPALNLGDITYRAGIAYKF